MHRYNYSRFRCHNLKVPIYYLFYLFIFAFIYFSYLTEKDKIVNFGNYEEEALNQKFIDKMLRMIGLKKDESI
jgi:hypothetical protein